MNKSKTQEVLDFNDQFPSGTRVLVKLPSNGFQIATITSPAFIMTDGVIRCRVNCKDGFLKINHVSEYKEPVQA